ncbi:MAG: response regulator [Chthoniobacter sp.]|nr:response regulator [Chthoniobacter sp.]
MDTIFETPTLPPPPEPQITKPTLLIVDDEEGPRQSLRIVFKNDYHVLLATNGTDAIELVKTNDVHVCVLDIMMMGISGVEALKEIKLVNPSVEVIMLTAFETIETARQALRHGASDYLNKPFDISTMRAAVAHAAQKHRANLEFKRGNEELHVLQEKIESHRLGEEMAKNQGEIYASVLHDINSPLTIISGFVELINRSIENADTVEGTQLDNIKGDLNRLNGQVARCVEISRRYLSFLNGQGTVKSYVAVNQVMSDLTELLSRHPSARGHELTVRGLDPDLTAAINGTDFLQILLNLTINALQSTPEPHLVSVSCQRHPEPLEIEKIEDHAEQRVINRDAFANRSPLLTIEVQDSGPGIPPEILRRMFEERFTTKPPEHGTGLGLSIVKRLVKEAEGALIIQTRLGVGSKFTVCLQTVP